MDSVITAHRLLLPGGQYIIANDRIEPPDPRLLDIDETRVLLFLFDNAGHLVYPVGRAPEQRDARSRRDFSRAYATTTAGEVQDSTRLTLRAAGARVRAGPSLRQTHEATTSSCACGSVVDCREWSSRSSHQTENGVWRAWRAWVVSCREICAVSRDSGVGGAADIARREETCSHDEPPTSPYSNRHARRHGAVAQLGNRARLERAVRGRFPAGDVAPLATRGRIAVTEGDGFSHCLVPGGSIAELREQLRDGERADSK